MCIRKGLRYSSDILPDYMFHMKCKYLQPPVFCHITHGIETFITVSVVGAKFRKCLPTLVKN